MEDVSPDERQTASVSTPAIQVWRLEPGLTNAPATPAAAVARSRCGPYQTRSVHAVSTSWPPTPAPIRRGSASRALRARLLVAAVQVELSWSLRPNLPRAATEQAPAAGRELEALEKQQAGDRATCAQREVRQVQRRETE